jgi:hypothetical protein
MPIHEDQDLYQDTSQLAVQGMPSVPTLPALADDTGTGANGPKYSTADFWSGVARNTIVGRAIDDVRAAQGASYSPFEKGSDLDDPYAAIPEDMKPYADKYIGLHTAEEIQYRTNQLRSQAYDARNGGTSKWAPVANLAAGLVDPASVASMSVPIAGETRVANALRMALVGAGVSTTDELALKQLDPNWTLASALKDVGAGTLISGIFGAFIRPHVTQAEFERLRAHLEQDLRAFSPEFQGPQGGDSAANIAADLRAAVEAHGQGLETQAATERAGLEGVDRAAAEERLKTAQEALQAVPRETTPEVRQAEATAESTRLGAGAGIPEHIDATLEAREQANATQRAGAEGELQAAQADVDRLTRAQAAEQELAAFHKTPGETPAGEPGYTVGEGELTDELKRRFQGLRSEVPAEQGALRSRGGESAESISGRQTGRTARGAEGASRGRGEPLPVYRGGRGGALTPEHFKPETFGKATGRPSSGLGVFFTNDKAEAAIYGNVTTHHLDIRNPLEIKAEDLPGFDSIADATKWRDEQQAKGHDGLVIDASHMGGQTWYVPFKHEQVLPAGLVRAGGGALERIAERVGSATTGDERRLALLDYLEEYTKERRAKNANALFESSYFGQKGDQDRGVARYAEEGKGEFPEAIISALQKENALDQETGESLNALADSIRGGHIAQLGQLREDLRTAEMDAAMEREALLEGLDEPALKRAIGDDTLRDELTHMAENETGRAQIGGKIIRKEINGGRGNEYEISRTSWIPNSEWWPGRPGGYNSEEVKAIVAKALEGKKLGPKQQQLIEYMTEVADQRRATHDYLPTSEELQGSGLDSHSEADAYETGMVARLAAIDEEAVENLARHFEEDDAGFMRKVKELLDAHDEDAKLARSGPQDQEPVGIAPDGGAPRGTAAEAGPRGQERTAAAQSERPATLSRPTDLFGESPTAAQNLADEQRRRDLKRNSGQESVETGDVGDLFSQARQQVDLGELLKRLPEEKRAPFEARIAALEDPAHAPLYSAPEGGQSMGAAAAGSREAELKDYSLARGGRILGKALGWFSPGSRALSSPSLAMRKVMTRLIEYPEMLEMNVPTKERPFGLPTPIAVQTILKRWEGQWAKGFAARDQIYREYKARPQAETEGPKLSKHEFNEQVSMAMRRNDTWYVPEIEKAAKATRTLVFDPLKVEAQKLGLLPYQEDLLRGTAESYLMRQYDRSKIRADQLGWHQVLVDGFARQGVERAEADEIAHAVTRNILGTELGLMDFDKSVFNNVPQSGRLLQRTLTLPDLELEKFLTNDIDVLSHSYLKSLAPQVEIMKAFRDDLRNDGLSGQKAEKYIDPQTMPSTKERRNLTGPAKDITDEYAILKQRAFASGDNKTANMLDRRMKADLRDLGAVRDRLYGIYGAPSDSSGWLQRSGRVIRSVNALRLLGTATWSHVPDLANVVMKRGLPQTMAMAAKLSTSLEALNMNREQLHRIGTVMDMIHNTTAAALGEFGVESNYAVQKALNRSTRAFTIATLETPWIATCKALAGAAAHDEILQAANKAARFRRGVGPDFSTNERIRFNQMGLSQDLLDRMADQFGQYGKTVNGVRFGMTDLWHDGGAAEALDAATAAAAEGSTLSPTAGDTPLWTSTEVGKAIFQFKTFGAVAIRRVTIPLAQGLAHGDLRAAQGLATLIAAGALTYTVKQKLSGQPIETNPERYALEVLDKSNLLGWAGEYFYPSLWQFGANNFSRWGDRQTWETLGGPVAGTAVDAWDLRIPAKVKGQISGDPKDAHFKRSDIHRIRRMLPANQVWYWRKGVNALEGQVGDAMGLPPEAPRGSSE